MKIGTDYLFTGTCAPYDFMELQLMVTDKDGLKYYAEGCGWKVWGKGKATTILSGNVCRIIIDRRFICHHVFNHELEHAKNMILWIAGVKARRNDDEADCYFIDYLSKWFYRKLKQAGIKVKTL